MKQLISFYCFPDRHSYHRTDNRSHNKQPELADSLHTGKQCRRDYTYPDISEFAVQIGYHTRGAAHHIAVSKRKIQSTAAGILAGSIYIDLRDQGLAGAKEHASAVLDQQQ